jgi:hypothetical protein
MSFNGIKDTFRTLTDSKRYQHALLSKLYRIIFRQQDWVPGQHSGTTFEASSSGTGLTTFTLLTDLCRSKTFILNSKQLSAEVLRKIFGNLVD